MIPGVLHAHGVDFVWLALLFVALAGSFTSTIYLAMTLIATVRHLRRAREARSATAAAPLSSLPPVTIFKPLHGMEEQLAANLESFFRQDYPDYEVIFGVRDRDNAAARIAEETRARYPHIPSRLIVSGPPVWPNAKIFSLAKMIASSSRSYFIKRQRRSRGPRFSAKHDPAPARSQGRPDHLHVPGHSGFRLLVVAGSSRALGGDVERGDGRRYGRGHAFRTGSSDGGAARCD